MPERAAAKKAAAKKASSRSSSGKFTAAEREAMKERARELKAEQTRESGEKDIQDKIAAMPKADRDIATKLHEIIAAVAPDLMPRTWYGMPAYAKDGDVLCFFQSADKFKARYAMLGFSDTAALDEGSMWPTYYAITKLTASGEREIRALVKRAVG